MRSESLILMYHGLLPEAGNLGDVPAADRIYTVTAEEFERHLRAVRESAWSPVPPERLSGPGRGKRLLISFDDSCLSHYTTAVPLLQKNEMPAVFFITVGEVGRPGCVTWEQLREMHAAGMSIQSHGFTHRFLSRLSETDLRDEMRRSREEIQARMGCEATMLSFPGGRYNRRTLEAAKECGYSLVFGSAVGVNRGGEAVLKRVPVTAGIDSARMSRILSDPGRRLLPSRLRFAATRLARTLLGERFYGIARGTVLGKVSRDRRGTVQENCVFSRKLIK